MCVTTINNMFAENKYENTITAFNILEPLMEFYNIETYAHIIYTKEDKKIYKGHNKIFDMTRGQFAHGQTRYHTI